MIYGLEEKNTDWGEDKVNSHLKEICLRVDICSVVFFSIQKCDYNTIIVGLVSFGLYWAQGLKDKEEGRMSFHSFSILKAVVNNICLSYPHWLNKNL